MTTYAAVYFRQAVCDFSHLFLRRKPFTTCLYARAGQMADELPPPYFRRAIIFPEPPPPLLLRRVIAAD